MDSMLVKELGKIACKFGFGWLVYKLLNKAMDKNYSVSAKHRDSSFSMSPQNNS